MALALTPLERMICGSWIWILRGIIIIEDLILDVFFWPCSSQLSCNGVFYIPYSAIITAFECRSWSILIRSLSWATINPINPCPLIIQSQSHHINMDHKHTDKAINPEKKTHSASNAALINSLTTVRPHHLSWNPERTNKWPPIKRRPLCGATRGASFCREPMRTPIHYWEGCRRKEWMIQRWFKWFNGRVWRVSIGAFRIGKVFSVMRWGILPDIEYRCKLRIPMDCL